MSINKYFNFAEEALAQHKKLNNFIKILFYLIVIVSNLMFLIYKLPYVDVFLWLFLLYISPSFLLFVKSKKNAQLLQIFIIFFVTLQSIGVLFCFGTVRDDICENIFKQYEVHTETEYDSEGGEIDVEVFETGHEFFDILLRLITDYRILLVILIYMGSMPLHHIVYNKRFLDNNIQDKMNNSA